MVQASTNTLPGLLREQDFGDRNRQLETLLQGLKKGQKQDGSGKELKKACQEFEAVFIQKIWQKMRQTLPQDGLFENRILEKYLSLFDREFSKDMAAKGGIGLSDLLYEQLQGELEAQSSQALFPAKEGSPDAAPGVPSRQEEAGGAPAENDRVEKESPRGEASFAKEKLLHQVEELARRIEARQGPAGAAGSPGATSSAALPPDSAPEIFSGSLPEMRTPVDGQVSSGFGWRKDPISGEKAWHSGVDLAAPKGTSVSACWPGRVEFSGEKEGYGKLVVVDHGRGWKSYYGHNSHNLVREGDVIRAGEKLAEVGDTGRSTGPHLHFEIRQKDTAWDPNQIRRRILAGLHIGKTA